MSGKKPAELTEQPPLPSDVAYLWEWYCEIHNGEPITFAELEAWSRLTRKNLTALEVDVMRKLYGVFIEVQNGRSITPNNQS